MSPAPRSNPLIYVNHFAESEYTEHFAVTQRPFRLREAKYYVRRTLAVMMGLFLAHSMGEATRWADGAVPTKSTAGANGSMMRHVIPA